MKNVLLLISFFVFSGLQAQNGPLPENKTLREVLKKIEDFNKAEQKRDSSLARPLGSHGEEDAKRNFDFYLDLQQQLKKMDVSKLSAADQINYELLLYSFEDDISSYQFKTYLNPILADGGFHTYLPSMANAPMRSAKEYTTYIDKLKDLTRYVDEHLVLMRKGLSLGISQPLVIFPGYENTYQQHIVNDATASVFYKPFAKKPVSISDTEWAAIYASGKAAIEKQVIPAYQSIKTFFDKEYLPATRKTLGAKDLPDGETFYLERVKHYTTTDQSIEDIYQTGLHEVERIQKAMQDVMNEVQFKGNLKEFIAFLRTDPRFYVKTPDDLLKEASYIAKKADGQLPLLFGKLPRQPYGVEPVPADLAPIYTGGRYSGAPITSKRAGHYWVNTYNLPSRPLYTLEALTLHEAVPGHHLQISLTQELENLPMFRRNLYVNAFGEGWGLYCEWLGYEMGFYKDPYNRFGQLTYDMWRACRLVIDVGLHAKGWTKEQAVAYLSDNTALSLHEVNTEINRYIAWPGQALAYKTGELKIKALRKKAEDALGEKFDVRRFHDTILSEGTVTMKILEKMVDRFIADSKK